MILTIVDVNKFDFLGILSMIKKIKRTAINDTIAEASAITTLSVNELTIKYVAIHTIIGKI